MPRTGPEKAGSLWLPADFIVCGSTAVPGSPSPTAADVQRYEVPAFYLLLFLLLPEPKMRRRSGAKMPGERMTIIFMLRYSLTVAEEVPADSAIGAVILSALRRHKAALPLL